MNARRFGAALLLSALLLMPAAGRAVEIARRSDGWRQADARASLALPLVFGNPRRGMISFDLQRLAGGEVEGRETLFELLDGQGRRVVRWKIEWASRADPRRPSIAFETARKDGGEFYRGSSNLWGPLIVFDQGVVEGQTVHLDLRWDDAEPRYELFLDGRPLDAHPGAWNPVRKAFDPDPRWQANQRSETLREELPFAPKPFGHFLEPVRTVILGSYDDPKRPHRRERTLLKSAVLANFVIAVDEPLADLHSAKHDVKGLRAAFTAAGVELSWSAPEIHGVDQQYVIYRRAAGEGRGRFEKLTAQPVRDLRFVDATASAGQTYRYSVTSVYGDGAGGTVEGKYPPEVTVTAAPLAVASVAAEKTLYGAGQEIVVTLRGTADRTATFTLEGIAVDAAMAEVDDGVYVGKIKVPAGLNTARASLAGALKDSAAGTVATLAGAPIAVDAAVPDPVPGLIISTPWTGEVEVSWQASPSADADRYRVLRATGASPGVGDAVYAVTRDLSFVDRSVIPGLAYHYAIVAVDKAGNPSAPSQIVSALALAGDGPRIAGVAVAPFGRPVKPGETITVTLTGASGGKASVDLGPLASGLALTEQGRTGAYTGSYTLKTEDVGATLAKAQTVVHLADDFGAVVVAGPELSVVGQDGLNDHTPPALTAVSHDGFRVARLSGALVAGDVVTVTAQGEPGGTAWFDIGGITTDRPMSEAVPGTGTYRGTYTVRFGDAGLASTVTAHLADAGGNETVLSAERTLVFDTRARLAVEAADKLLPADRASKTRLTARAFDANGEALTGHELTLTLSTTEEYTGVVGGGSLAGRQATMADVDDVEVKWGGVTDNFGQVTADYTAGFAAKTALVVAKDLTTGDVGVGWLNTYVSSTVAIELTPRASKGAEDRAVLRMSADPTKLTADGRSTSRIKVWLTDLSGKALTGASVSFALGNANGRLKVLRDTTDGKGVAEAEYRAGTAIGTVTVTASAAAYGVTGSQQITLMSDAPAKIDLVASAAKLVANGSDAATLSVAVTDIHGNPNHEVPVAFAVLKGGGRLSTASLLTDRNGEGSATYTAGNRPGVSTIEARHTSRAPTEAELRRVYGTLFVPRWFERQERDRLTVQEWLVKPGEAVTKGQTLVVLATRRSEWVVASPAKGVFVREVKHESDAAELGESLGYVEIDPEVWRAQFAQ